MILYKYVSYDAGIKIIDNNSIGFSQPIYFNDPFELEAAYPQDEGKNPLEMKLNDIRVWGKKYIWKENTGILSLTRSPLNALMWAHYSEEHTGFVIGIDTAIKEFTCEKINLVPVQYGSVIYTDSKPIEDFLSKPKEVIQVGGTYHFPIGQLERLQRIFLFKPMCWSYEEEVRVVKCLKGIDKGGNLPSGNFSTIEVFGRPMYLLSLPKGAIQEIYLGVRNKELDESRDKSFLKKLKESQPQSKVLGCRVGSKTWRLEAFDLIHC